MKQAEKRIVLTGFMGVGKSTVAWHLSNLTGMTRVDLDEQIEKSEKCRIPEIIKNEGIDHFRQLEAEILKQVLDDHDAGIISLGGGAWTSKENREAINKAGCTAVWLESTFEHCWRNISHSRKVRPLVKDKAQARRLFEERERVYCLADWHFVIDPGHNSFEVAKRIAVEICMVTVP